VSRHPLGVLIRFLALTFAVSWTSWLVASAIEIPILHWLVFMIGVFAPSLVALGLTHRAEGEAGTRALLSRILEWQVGARFYLFAAGYMAAIKLLVALTLRVATGAWPRFGDDPWYIILAAIPLATPTQAGEEIGWRGYALPRLAAGIGFGRAGVLLGAVWAFWHLPLFFLPGLDTTGQSFPVYLLQVTALSVAMTWLYARTNGSLLPVMVMHSAVNQTLGIVPSGITGATNPLALSTSSVAWLTLLFLWIGAAYFLIQAPALRFDRGR
jgi:uncharacterized protein